MESKIVFTEVPYEGLHSTKFISLKGLRTMKTLKPACQRARNYLFHYDRNKPTFSTMAKYGIKLERVTGKQCSNKWKKLEDMHKKIKERSDKQEC